jgi:hypothetical protein
MGIDDAEFKKQKSKKVLTQLSTCVISIFWKHGTQVKQFAWKRQFVWVQQIFVF